LSNRTMVYVESEKLYNTLFNSISHELRTPIAAILTAADGLRSAVHTQDADRLGTPDPDLTAEIHTAAERLNRLVENLLDMTRLETGHCAPRLDWCDIRDIINASLKKLEPELARHRVVISIAETVTLVKLDFGLIEQALTNLLHNASVYTPEDAVVTIEAHLDKGSIVIGVRDTGPGFPAASLPRLFDKFFRIPGSKTGGTGLGLSIVRGYVEAHKGTIEAANHPSGGAAFTIRIPTMIHTTEHA
jgi:two-component system, OmpR family, sensor histidine kinase KdpD